MERGLPRQAWKPRCPLFLPLSACALLFRLMFGGLARKLGKGLARYLSKPRRHYTAFDVTDPNRLAGILIPGDVLLVDGASRISTGIKYLTQSTWSHAALYVGTFSGTTGTGTDATVLIEADVVEGVIAVPLSKYAHMNTRICRPVSLNEAERQQVCRYVIDRIGHAYDLKNVFDLPRYLFPTPPVPVSWRRRMLGLGSGDPTRAICSTLIAQAFQSVSYPILPYIERPGADAMPIHHLRHHTLFVPRDFDISPYFMIVKPTQETGFDHHLLTWAETRPGTGE